MQTIALQAIPKQSLSIVLDNILYEIALLETNGCMSLNLTRGGEPVVNGQRCVAGTLLLPYKTLEKNFGNFMFLTNAGDLPYYDQFTATQALLYASPADLEAARDGTN